MLDSGGKVPDKLNVGNVNDADVGVEFDSNLNKWDETATWRWFNSRLELSWENAGGDWSDANGEAQGSLPFSEVRIVDDDQPGTVEIDVLKVINKTNRADFFIRRVGGVNYGFKSREAGKGGPTLILNGDTILNAVADTSLHGSTVSALGKSKRLATQGSFLVSFRLARWINSNTSNVKNLSQLV